MNWPRMTTVQRAAGSGIAFDGCHHFAPSTDLASSIDDALSARPLTSDTENHASDTAVQLMNTRPRPRVVGSMAKSLVPRIDPRSSVAHRIVARVATSPTGISVLRNVGPRFDPALVPIQRWEAVVCLTVPYPLDEPHWRQVGNLAHDRSRLLHRRRTGHPHRLKLSGS